MRIFSRLLPLILLLSAFCLRADILCGTWNLRLFPSGRNNLKGSPEREQRAIQQVASLFKSSLSPAEGPIPCLFFLQEVRDEESCRKVAESSGIKGLSLCAFSHLEDPPGIPLWRQLAILSTLPPLACGQGLWESQTVKIPRGYLYALFSLPGGKKLLAINLHLKSNLDFSGTSRGRQLNILKRELAAEEILNRITRFKRTYGEDLKVIVAGDFNTDRRRYRSEGTLFSFKERGFHSCFDGVPPARRVTVPARGRFPDTTFDYILYQGFQGGPGDLRIRKEPLVSDHNLLLFRLRDP